jgi:sugar-specific transcriptional regulator TrmB
LLIQENAIQLLTQIGFTKTQAQLYLTLIDTGKTDVKNLSRHSNLPRQTIYRTLNELQEKGVVERIISLPQEYKAISPPEGLSTILSAKANEYNAVIEKTKNFLLKFGEQGNIQTSDDEYTISIVSGKETLIKRAKHITDKVQFNVIICSTIQRWLHFNSEIIENVEAALARGVKYRVVLENANSEINFPKELKPILSHPNHEVRIVRDRLKINAALFDGKEASINFYPSKSIAESPMIWTNHPSLLVGLQDHFEKIWGQAKKFS